MEYPHENSVLLRQWGIAVSHAPLFFYHRRRFIPTPSAKSFCIVSTAFSAISRCFCLSALAQCTQPLCATYLRSVPPRSDTTNTSLATFEVLYARSSDSQGSSIYRPPRFMLWPRIYLRSALTSSNPKISGNKDSHRESSIGPIRDPTPGKFFLHIMSLEMKRHTQASIL